MSELSSRRILVVDDDEGLLLLMAEALRADGYQVATANSGATAIAATAERAPNLMVLDLKLRDLAWPTLLKRLKGADDATVPFIVVTGQGDEKVAVEVMKQGALDYVIKTTGLMDLLPGVVRRALMAVERERALATAQARVRESEARFASALRATNDGVWEWLIPENRVYFSDRWKAILGYAPGEIADDYEEWQKRIHREDRDRLEKAQVDFFAGNADTFNIEYRLQHKDGSSRWILLQAFLHRDTNGRPLRMTGAHTDVTERKQLEKEILRISDREQWRIGQDLHDGLGQQLTAIEFMCQSLRSDLTTVSPDLARQTSQMGGLLREAIAQTRSLAHGLTPFMLDASGLQAALAELAERTGSLGRKVRCRFVCPAAVLVEDRDAAGHLYRIAQEAVNNALKHSGGGEIVIQLSRQSGVLQMTVSDDGNGLSRHRKHHGIGLQVMQHRANAIGAELTIDSKKGKGVSVTCSLHRTHERAE